MYEGADMERKRRILVTNDDGIEAEGIIRLARMASALGEVYVAAPVQQCSGMSQKLTIFDPIRVEESGFPVPVAAAWSIDGTPCDCVKLALEYLMDHKPDYVFSGINNGCNVGFDIAYSGTMGAAYEAVMQGIPAIAFSKNHGGSFDICEENMLALTEECILSGQERGEVWNLNFPSCPAEELRGIKRNTFPAPTQLYSDRYILDGNVYRSKAVMISATDAPEGSDAHAVLNGFISVGKIKCAVL